MSNTPDSPADLLARVRSDADVVVGAEDALRVALDARNRSIRRAVQHPRVSLREVGREAHLNHRNVHRIFSEPERTPEAKMLAGARAITRRSAE